MMHQNPETTLDVRVRVARPGDLGAPPQLAGPGLDVREAEARLVTDARATGQLVAQPGVIGPQASVAPRVLASSDWNDLTRAFLHA